MNWETAQWDAVNMKEITVDQGNLCTGAEIGHVLVPGRFNMFETLKLCRSFGGDTSVVDNLEIQEQLRTMFSESEVCTGIGVLIEKM